MTSVHESTNATSEGKAAQEDLLETAIFELDDDLDILNLGKPRGPRSSNKVTFQVMEVMPENYYPKERLREGPVTPHEVLQKVHPDTKKHCKEIIWSSIGNGPSNSGTSNVNLVPRSRGFVKTVVDAYNGHYHLEIRPDDVWISIITQFSLFINANAERFGSMFVAFSGTHDLFGKRRLSVLSSWGTRKTLNYGLFAVGISKLLQQKVLDPELREWILPGFSTTTANDTIASSMIMMSTLGKYFSFRCTTECGIPTVTLHGEKRDWENLLTRIEKLKEFGLEMTMWYHLLEPVLKRFVKAWDDPHGEWNRQFWGRVTTTEMPVRRSGKPQYLTGWLTAFIPFDNQGKWQFERAVPAFLKANMGETELKRPGKEGTYPNLSRSEFMLRYNTDANAYPKSNYKNGHPLSVRYSGFGIEVFGIKSPYPPKNDEKTMWRTHLIHPSLVDGDMFWSWTQLVIDGTWYPRHDEQDIPTSVCHIELPLDEAGRSINSVMVAGIIGYNVKQIAKRDPDSNDSGADKTIPRFESSLKPEVGWWIYEKRTEEEIEKWEAEQKQKNPYWY